MDDRQDWARTATAEKLNVLDDGLPAGSDYILTGVIKDLGIYP